MRTNNVSYQNQNGISLDAIRRIAPSVFATQPASGLSSRYSFIPTAHVVESLVNNGFVVTEVAQSRSLAADGRDWAKHLLRFRQVDGPRFDEGVPEILLINSHDGTSAYKLLAGIFRFICENGLVVGSSFGTFKVRHTGRVDDVVDAAFQVVSDFPKVIDRAESFRELQLTAPEQRLLAEAAIEIRYPDSVEPDEEGKLTPAPISADQVLLANRRGDNRNDLWTTYNRIQENLIRGGIRTHTPSGRRSRTRGITGIDQNVALNRALWGLAEGYARIKHGESIKSIESVSPNEPFGFLHAWRAGSCR